MGQVKQTMPLVWEASWKVAVSPRGNMVPAEAQPL